MYVCICTCRYIYIYICLFIYLFIYLLIYLFIYIYMSDGVSAFGSLKNGIPRVDPARHGDHLRKDGRMDFLIKTRWEIHFFIDKPSFL